MSKAHDARRPADMALTHVELLRALSFAADKHVAQKRKGAAQEPYLNHLVDVAHILSETAAGGDIALLMAALLHDTIEDQEVTAEEIEAAFGDDVRDLVVAATDQKGLLKAERKRLQVETAPHKTPRASLLKTADKTSNLRSIACSPPDGWSADRMADYV
ncbi:MAG: HD domain-containing protein, partial [Pseudomonadota bacterium]